MMKVLAPLVVGIIIAPWFQTTSWWALVTGSILMIMIPLLSRKVMGWGSVFLISACVMLGVGARLHSDPTIVHRDFVPPSERAGMVFLVDEVVERDWGHRLTLQLRQCADCKGDELGVGVTSNYYGQEVPVKGDLLFARTRLREIQGPEIPFEFDRKSYLASHGIFYRCKIDEEQVEIIGHETEGALSGMLGAIRAWVESRLENSSIATQEKALAKALVLGDKSSLDHEVRSDFADAGGIHVLAVSGLHAGILLSFFMVVTAVFRRGKGRQWGWTIAGLLVLWVFAAVTGFSPSVTRASIMFSFLYLGRLIRSDTPGIASISLSAVLILVFDPMALFDLGFLLSFAAISGIIHLAEPIRDFLFGAEPKLPRLADLISVSIAAQLATLPISLLVFHQFPVYFLLTNILLIPWAWLALTMVLSSVFLADVPFVGEGLFWCTDMLLGGAVVVVDWVAGLPGGLVNGIRLSFFSAIALSLGCASLYFWIRYRSRNAIYVMVTLSVSMSVDTIWRGWNEDPPKVILHNGKDGWSMQWNDAGRSMLVEWGAGHEWTRVRRSTMNQVFELDPGFLQIQDSIRDYQVNGYLIKRMENGNLVFDLKGQRDTLGWNQTLVLY